jgi:hypothetical protein
MGIGTYHPSAGSRTPRRPKLSVAAATYSYALIIVARSDNDGKISPFMRKDNCFVALRRSNNRHTKVI